MKGDGLMMMQLPATSAGAIFHTASSTGKFHGTMPPTTPSGVNRVTTRRSALSSTTSSSSDCVAISRSHSADPRISHSAPARGLPCSRVRRAMNSSACSSRTSPIALTIAWRSSSGVRDHVLKASRAAATLSSSWASVALGTSAMTSFVAGLYTGKVCSHRSAFPSMVRT